MFLLVLFPLLAAPLLGSANPPLELPQERAPKDRSAYDKKYDDEDDEMFLDARKMLDEGNCDGAAIAFAEIVEGNPEFGRAWFYYGYCIHMCASHTATEDERVAVLERARSLHLKAANFDMWRASAMYNAACASALLGDTEAAFRYLDGAFHSGFSWRLQVKRDPDLKSLRGDSRFAQYLPQEKTLPSFKGNVRVLYSFHGEAPGDQFGWRGRNAGDCDGDGKFDMVLSAPYRRYGKSANAGKIYVYSGATGKILFERYGAAGETLGVGLDAAGDVNNDGFADIIAGASHADRMTGKAYVFSGVDGSVLLSLSGQKPGDLFGAKVCGTGDLTGDGHADVLIGAPGSDEQGADSGRVYLFSGKDGNLLATVDGERPGDGLGTCVAGTSAFGKRLIAVGAADAGLTQRGRVYVYEFTPGKRPDCALVPLFGIEADRTGVHLGGMFLSFVGDIDGDDWPDVYASDWENKARGRSTGRAYVHSGRTGKRILSLTGERAGDGFGIGPGRAGDANGDGFDDLIIGAWRNSDGAPMAGKCYLFSGANGEVLEEFVCTVEGDTFGFDATGMGDLDGDGGIDFLITSAWSGCSGKKSGRAVVIAGPVFSKE